MNTTDFKKEAEKIRSMLAEMKKDEFFDATRKLGILTQNFSRELTPVLNKVNELCDLKVNVDIAEQMEHILENLEEMEREIRELEVSEETTRNTIADVLDDLTLNYNGKTKEKITRLAEFIRDSQSDISDKNKVLVRLY